MMLWPTLVCDPMAAVSFPLRANRSEGGMSAKEQQLSPRLMTILAETHVSPHLKFLNMDWPGTERGLKAITPEPE